MVEVSVRSAEPLRPAGILQQNRVFLDFFWDLAKPDQEVRLKAVENLIQYLKTENKADELEYTFKRLVDGLAHTRETARPGFSLALGQEPQVVLGCVQLLQTLTQHKQHLKDLPSKTMTDILTEVTTAAWPHLHILTAVSRSPPVKRSFLGPQIPEEVFEEVLLGALQADLASAFRTPEQLQLLLVALQRFPQALKPKKLKKLLGSSTIINADNIPK
ncbi:hypothetical protein GOODEAATRI_015282 [Goodea atripinnis]|uniref:Uncharacterized protein n=1 Tax=Goodea atripinnis TaxID=208336 RepID=A0ABV0NUT0_9TELE